MKIRSESCPNDVGINLDRNEEIEKEHDAACQQADVRVRNGERWLSRNEKSLLDAAAL